MFPFVCYRILLGFSIILYVVSLFLLLFYFAEKTFSFETLSKGTFGLLTCHLLFSITAKVSTTLKRQSVQSLSDHKTARPRTFCVSQERANSPTNGLEQNKWLFPLVWGGGGREEWVKLGREAKPTSKKYDRNWHRQNKGQKTSKKKKNSLKAVGKLVLLNPFLLINNKLSAKRPRRSSWIYTSWKWGNAGS